MKKILNQAVVAGLLAVSGLTVSSAALAGDGGVDYRIAWDAKAGLYRVYMKPTTTPVPDKHISAQVTLRVPHNPSGVAAENFTATSLTSIHKPSSWTASSAVRAPAGYPDYDYISFTTSAVDIPFGWSASVEQEVFNFANSGKCLGPVTFISTTESADLVAADTNAGNQFNNLGWDGDSVGNDFLGTYGTDADCSAVAVNNPPTAQDMGVTTAQDSQDVLVDVLSKAVDPDADDLVVSAFDATTAKGGTVTSSTDSKKLFYTPAAGFSGTDTFSYTVSDGKGGTVTATATVTVTPKANTPPTAHDINVTTIQDSKDVLVDVLSKATDDNGDNLVVSAFDATTAKGGTVTRSADSTQLFYTPKAGFSGTDTFSYTISDGKGGTVTATATINVSANANTLPTTKPVSATVQQDSSKNVIDVIAQADDLDGDALTISAVDSTSTNGGTITTDGTQIFYTPKAGFSGTDSFSYTLSDGKGGTVTATATINVTAKATNAVPNVPNVNTSTTFNTAVSINVLANAKDPDGDNLVVQAVDPTSTNGGTVSLGTNGTILYKPKADFSGNDSFNFTVSDGKGGVVQATVTITVGIKTANGQVAVPTLSEWAQILLGMLLAGVAFVKFRNRQI